MKKTAAMLVCLLMAGCSPSSQVTRRPALPDIPKTETTKEEREIPSLVQSLQKVDENTSSAQLELLFSQLLNQTAQAYASGLEIYSIAYDQTPRITSANMLVQSSYQVNTIYSSWIDNQTLYQVARYETSDETGYRGDIQLSRIDAVQNIAVLCELQDPEQFYQEQPELTISRIDTTPVSIEGNYDRKRLNQMLVNRQMQYISGALGNYLQINPLSDPQLFDFYVSPDEDGYIFGIQIKDLAAYNKKADRLNPKRSYIDETQNIQADSYQTDEIWVDLHLNEAGIIESVSSTMQDSYTLFDQSFQILEEQQLYLRAVPDAKALSFLEGFFEQVEARQWKTGSLFQLQVPISQMN